MKPGLYVGHGKRRLDLCIPLPVVILLLPMAALIGILILVLLGRPVFFVQSRPGLNARAFRLIKFRTMQDSGSRNWILEDDEERRTRFGRLLRSTSLDEISELINVIKGEMSLVGPRPLLTKYLTLYTRSTPKTHRGTRHHRMGSDHVDGNWRFEEHIHASNHEQRMQPDLCGNPPSTLDRAQDTRAVWVDTTAAQKKLGWRPRIQFREFVEIMVRFELQPFFQQGTE